jgi:hypothetical protein
MHTLMAQAQRRGDLPQRGAAQVQPADRAMEIGSGALRLTLGLISRSATLCPRGTATLQASLRAGPE